MKVMIDTNIFISAALFLSGVKKRHRKLVFSCASSYDMIITF